MIFFIVYVSVIVLILISSIFHEGYMEAQNKSSNIGEIDVIIMLAVVWPLFLILVPIAIFYGIFYGLGYLIGNKK